jgi:hypothetical protein
MKLTEHLVVRMGKTTRDSVASFVVSDQNKLHELIDMVSSGTKPQRMKGAWVLSTVHTIDSEVLVPYHNQLLNMLRLEAIGGVRRELLRCFEGARLNNTVADELVMIAMDWVTDETQDLAVRYICYRLLKPLLKQHPELEVELQQQVEFYRSKFGRFP